MSPFRAELAFARDEGDRTLAWWREAHRACFTRTVGAGFSEDAPAVFERFELVHPPEPAGR